MKIKSVYSQTYCTHNRRLLFQLPIFKLSVILKTKINFTLCKTRSSLTPYKDTYQITENFSTKTSLPANQSPFSCFFGSVQHFSSFHKTFRPILHSLCDFSKSCQKVFRQLCHFFSDSTKKRQPQTKGNFGQSKKGVAERENKRKKSSC